MFAENYGDLNPYELLARMWVVARYDDKGLHKALTKEKKKQIKKGEYGVFILDDDHPIIKNSRQLTELCHLVALFVHEHDEYYVGKSFLLDYREDWFSKDGINRPSHHVGLDVVMLAIFSDAEGNLRDGPERWDYFPNVISNLKEVLALIDAALKGDIDEKLLYIASLLRTAGHDADDEKTKIVILVSIIELLLTHNPDFNRYNIEDSINKQFQLKAATLIYLNSEVQDINLIKGRLKEIYSLRSGIAHGDFKAVKKYTATHQKKGEEYPLVAVISKLYRYLRVILRAYLKDSKFVDFLKEG